MAGEISSGPEVGLSSSAGDAEILKLFDEIVMEWWVKSFSKYQELFTPPQRLAVPLISQERNVPICTHTGSGKTLSAFISIINELFTRSRADGLENGVYCLYISPLKSLANGIHKNLEKPLSEIQSLAKEKGIETQEVRHAIRHEDISARDKARMLRTATIEPLDEISAFLAGNSRPIEIVDTRFSRQFDLKLLCPLPDRISTSSREFGDRLYQALHEHIQAHKSTLIFTNYQEWSREGSVQSKIQLPGEL
jgi:Lhr-like helicase